MHYRLTIFYKKLFSQTRSLSSYGKFYRKRFSHILLNQSWWIVQELKHFCAECTIKKILLQTKIQKIIVVTLDTFCALAWFWLPLDNFRKFSKDKLPLDTFWTCFSEELAPSVTEIPTLSTKLCNAPAAGNNLARNKVDFFWWYLPIYWASRFQP